MAHWPHSVVNYKSESSRSVPHQYHIDITIALVKLERYICLTLAQWQQYSPPLRLCAFAPLRETRKFGSRGNFIGSFSQRRKGAKRIQNSEADND
jgi:hypothetical protein